MHRVPDDPRDASVIDVEIHVPGGAMRHSEAPWHADRFARLVPVCGPHLFAITGGSRPDPGGDDLPTIDADNRIAAAAGQGVRPDVHTCGAPETHSRRERSVGGLVVPTDDDPPAGGGRDARLVRFGRVACQPRFTSSRLAFAVKGADVNLAVSVADVVPRRDEAGVRRGKRCLVGAGGAVTDLARSDGRRPAVCAERCGYENTKGSGLPTP
jgi:hypothetical protein